MFDHQEWIRENVRRRPKCSLVILAMREDDRICDPASHVEEASGAVEHGLDGGRVLLCQCPQPRALVGCTGRQDGLGRRDSSFDLEPVEALGGCWSNDRRTSMSYRPRWRRHTTEQRTEAREWRVRLRRIR